MALSNLRTGITVRQERTSVSPLVVGTTLPMVLVGLNRDLQYRATADLFDWSGSTAANAVAFPNFTTGRVEAGTSNPGLAPHFYVSNEFGVAELLNGVTLTNVSDTGDITGTPSFDIAAGVSATFEIASSTAGAFAVNVTNVLESVFEDLTADFVISRVGPGDVIKQDGVATWEVASVSTDEQLLVRRVGKGPEGAGPADAAKMLLSAEDTNGFRTLTTTSTGFEQSNGWGLEGTKVSAGHLVRIDNWNSKESSGGLIYGAKGEDAGSVVSNVTLGADHRLITFPSGTLLNTSYGDWNNGTGDGAMVFTRNNVGDLVPSMYFAGTYELATRSAPVLILADSPLLDEETSDFGVAYSAYNYVQDLESTSGAFGASVSSTRIFSDTSVSLTGASVNQHIALKDADGTYRPLFVVTAVNVGDGTLDVQQFSAGTLPTSAVASNVEYKLLDFSLSETGSSATVTSTFADDAAAWSPLITVSGGEATNFASYAIQADDRLLSTETAVAASLTLTMSAVPVDSESIVVNDGTASAIFEFYTGADNTAATTIGVPITPADTDATQEALLGAINGSSLAIGVTRVDSILTLTHDNAGIDGNLASVDVGADVGSIWTTDPSDADMDGRTSFAGGVGNDFSAGLTVGDLIFDDAGILYFRIVALPTSGSNDTHNIIVRSHTNAGTVLQSGDALSEYGFSVREGGSRADFVVRRVVSDTQLEISEIAGPVQIPSTRQITGAIWFQDGAPELLPVSVTVPDSLANVAYTIEKTLSDTALTGSILVTYAAIKDNLVGIQELSVDTYEEALGAPSTDNPLALAATVAFANSSANLFVVQVPSESLTDWIAAAEATKTAKVYNVVPLTSDDAVLGVWQAHVAQESQPDNKRERILWQSHRFLTDVVRASLAVGDNPVVSRTAGGATTIFVQRDLVAFGVIVGDDFSGTTFDGAATVAFSGRITSVTLAGSTTTIGILSDGNVPLSTANLTVSSYDVQSRPLSITELRDVVAAYPATIRSRRIRNVFPDQYEMQFTDSSGFYGGGIQTRTVTGEYQCVVEAAKRTRFGPAAPLTKRAGTGVYRVLDTFADSLGSQDAIIDAGNYYVEQPSGPGTAVKPIRALTTDITDLVLAEESVTPQIDSFVRSLRAQLDPILGPHVMDKRFFDIVSANAAAVVTRVLSNKEMDTIKLISIKASTDTADTFLMEYEVIPLFSGARADLTIRF